MAGGAATRWPTYTPGVHALGVRAVFAFPLQVGVARLGMIEVFRTRPGGLSTDHLALAPAAATIHSGTCSDPVDSSSRPRAW